MGASQMASKPDRRPNGKILDAAHSTSCGRGLVLNIPDAGTIREIPSLKFPPRSRR
jgi:hypothetical protein